MRLVVRFPRLNAPMPSLIDRYISRIYVRVAGLSFLALLGLFYISTFIDRSDKVFKGQATTAMLGQLLVLLTPQFIYYVIPIAALLSALVTYGLLARSSELTVMKACGISLYRTALSVIVLSLAFSVVLFSLEQRLMATANRQAEVLDAKIRGRQPRTINLLTHRWVVGADKVIYYYGTFDPEKSEMLGLTMFAPRADRWELMSETFVRRAVFADSKWIGEQGWKQDFRTDPPKWTTIDRSPLPGLESPEYFTTAPPDAELMSVTELQRYITELEPTGFNTTPLKVELHRKLAFPFVTLVMTLLAVPFGDQRREAWCALRHRPRDRHRTLLLDSHQRVRGDRQGRAADSRPRRMGTEHPRCRARGLPVSSRAYLTRLRRTLRRDLLQGQDEVAREDALTVALP